jgi:uncharacterized protein YndB with AHSA1/START domain
VSAITESTKVERELTIAASPETVWELLVDPEQAVRWMGQVATLDAHPGGLYRVEVIPGNTARGEFVVVDRPRRLVHTWGWEPESGSTVTPGSTTVEYELIPTDGGTTLRFTHRDLPSEEAATSHAQGWDHYFERLVAVSAGGDPGRDPWLDGPMK